MAERGEQYMQCNVIDLLCNNIDAVYYYTSLLTTYIQVCFCLNVFQTRSCYIWLQLIYMTDMPMGVANYTFIYDLIGQHFYTNMYMLVIIYQWGYT